MSVIWDRLSMQCRDGIFDVDGIALILEVMKIPDGYVFGGAEDFRCFLSKVGSYFTAGSVIYFLIRDYEPHFIAGMLFIRESVDLFIIDSTPDATPNLAKWDILMQPFFSSYRIFMNVDQLQYDDYSCKLFSLNVLRRLNKQDPLIVHQHLIDHGILHAEHLYLLPENTLLPFLMKDVQSLTRLNQYLEQFPNDRLSHYIDRHSEFIPGVNKKRNYSIPHHLTRYRTMIESFGSNRDYSEIREILMKRLGLTLPHSTSITPSIQSSHNVMTVTIPMITPFPGSQEIPWPEDLTTPFFMKRPEKYPECIIEWLPYRVFLRQTHCLTDTWIDLVRYDLIYEVDLVKRHVILKGSRENLDNFLKRTLQEIRNDPISMIERGCHQLLATYNVLIRIHDSITS